MIRDEKDIVLRALNRKNWLLQQLHVYNYCGRITYEEKPILESIKLEINKGLKRRHIMFTLLFDQQMRRIGSHCSGLHNLPIEMFRLVDVTCLKINSFVWNPIANRPPCIPARESHP